MKKIYDMKKRVEELNKIKTTKGLKNEKNKQYL